MVQAPLGTVHRCLLDITDRVRFTHKKNDFVDTIRDSVEEILIRAKAPCRRFRIVAYVIEMAPADQIGIGSFELANSVREQRSRICFCELVGEQLR